MGAEETNETILLTEAVEGSYGAVDVKLHCLARGGKSVYKVTHLHGPDWILRAYPLPDADANDDSPQRLAEMLQFLQGRDYLTESIVSAAGGSQVTASGNYQLLITSYLGQALYSWQSATAGAADAPAFGYSPKTMQSFGEALGQLHALRGDTPNTLPTAGMSPASELAWAADCLRRCAPHVPRKHQAEHLFLTSEVERLDRCEDLPHCLIHNDCNFSNAVYMPSGQVALVDWEGAGLGPAVLDVGFVLSSCFDKQRGQLQTEALEAFVEGHRQRHQLTDAGLEHLPDAVRFRTLVLLACCFSDWATGTRREDALIYGAAYADWQKQYHASKQIVQVAQKLFRQHSATRPAPTSEPH